MSPKVAYRALGSRSGVGRGVLGALDRCCEHVGLSLVRRPFRAGSAGVEIDAHGHGVRRDGCRGLQAEATPAIAATEDSHALLGIVVVEDARRSGPPAGAGQAAFDPDPRISLNVAHVVGAVSRGSSHDFHFPEGLSAWQGSPRGAFRLAGMRSSW